MSLVIVSVATLCWLVFFFFSYKLNLIGVKEFHLRNCFHQIGLYTSLCGHFFYGSITPGQVLLSYIRKQAE